VPVPKHIKINIRGRFDGTPEQWSYGFHLDPVRTAQVDIKVADYDMSIVAAAINAFHSHARFPAKVVVEEWRAYDIGSDGRMIGNPVLGSWSAATQPKGLGAGNLTYPPQASLVVTLEAANRGPARYGRMYLPQPYMILDSTARLAATDVSSIGSALRTMLKAIEGANTGADDSHLCNVSPGGRTSTPTKQSVINLKMGRVIDTMRSRRSKMDEDRQTVTY